MISLKEKICKEINSGSFDNVLFISSIPDLGSYCAKTQLYIRHIILLVNDIQMIKYSLCCVIYDKSN